MHSHVEDETDKDGSSETPAWLKQQKQYLEKQKQFGQNKRERLERLLVRKSTAKLSPEKRARMVRRHMTAITQSDTAEQLLSQVNFRIEQITHQQ